MPDTTEPTFPLTVTNKQRSSAAPFWSLWLKVVRSLPTYNDSKKGRANALQVRFAFLVIGIICVAFGESNAWIAAGVLLCIVPLIVPVESGRRTAWMSSIRRKMTSEKTRSYDVTLTREKNRVVLEGGPEPLSFSIKKAPRRLDHDGASWLGYRSKDKTRIWLRCDAIDTFAGSSPEENERFDLIVDLPRGRFEEFDRG